MDQPRLLPYLSGRDIQRRVTEIAQQIDADYPESPDAPELWLVGALKGAAFFLTDLARAIRRGVAIDFVQTSSYGTGVSSSGNVRIIRDIENDVCGADVILVEDIIDSGRTAYAMLDLFQARGARTVRLAALLDKPSRRVQPVPLHYVGFTAPDRFVVGYGMDYSERYRSLPEICFAEFEPASEDAAENQRVQQAQAPGRRME